MLLETRFDTKDNIEIINGKKFSLGANLITFISLDMENILNDKIISNLTENNYKKVISNMESASHGAILQDIINTNDILSKTNIDEIKSDLILILNTYNKFKELIDFCYLNNNFNNMTPLQKYLHYLDRSITEEVILPKQTISLKAKGTSNKHLKNNNITENSPYLCFSYQCLNINDYMLVTFLELIKNNYFILKCKNCNKYFITYNRIETYYCDRQAPQDTTKTCKQYGAEKAWTDRTKDENDWYNLYRKVYQSFQMKSKRNPNNPQLKENFDNFRTDANKWKKAVKDGTKTEEEFMYWLKEFRK